MNEPRYVFGPIRGTGGFGVVREARMTRGDGSSSVAVAAAPSSSGDSEGADSNNTAAQTVMVAVKEIPPKKVDLESKRLVREVDILGMLSVGMTHPCVLRLLDAYVTMQGNDGFSVNLVMPLYSGDLHQFAKEIHKAAALAQQEQQQNISPSPALAALQYNSQVARVLAFRTIAGLAYVHSCKLVHRDMKPDNIMITIDRVNPNNSEAVVGDFGLARAVSPTETFYTCTRQYRPPEVVTNTAKGNSSMDIWSLGCVLFELVTGVHLFQVPSARDRENNWVPALASQQLEAMLDVFGTPSIQEIPFVAGANVQTYLQKTRQRPSEVKPRFEREFRLACSPEDKAAWFSLINACLQFVPDKRATAEQLLRHDLFAQHGMYVVNGEQSPEQRQKFNVEPTLVIQAPPARVYRGGSTRDDIRSNKETILALVRRIHDHMFPRAVAGVGTSDDAGTQQLVFPNPTTMRVGQWFGNVEAVLADPEGALDGALEAMRMTADLTPAEKMDLENIAAFCRLRLEEDKGLVQD